MEKNVILEFKKINGDFSVFKYKSEDKKHAEYGLCFNYEIENFTKGIYPKEGIKYHYFCKEEIDRYIEEKEYDYFFREDKYKFLIIEETLLFEDFDNFFNQDSQYYLLKIDDNGIATDYYNNLKYPLPLEICGKLDTDIYSPIFIKHLETVKKNFIVSKYELKTQIDFVDEELDEINIEEIENNNSISDLRNKFNDWLNFDEETVEEHSFETPSNGWGNIGESFPEWIMFEDDSNSYKNSMVDFIWFPTKEEWGVFYNKYIETDYATAIEFLLNGILKIAKNNKELKVGHFEHNLVAEQIVKTLKVNDTISFYKHTLKIQNQSFSTYDICLTKELEELEKDFILPQTITCEKQNMDSWSRIFIARKEYLSLIKQNANYLYDKVKRQEFLYSPKYFMETAENIDFSEYVFIQEICRDGHFYYVNYLTGYPLITSIAFDEDRGNPINKNNYDLEKIKNILKDREDIEFKKAVSIMDTLYAYENEERVYNCLNFVWYPTDKDWQKLCDEYLLDSSYFDCLPGHFYNMKTLLQHIANEILQLPTKEEK